MPSPIRRSTRGQPPAPTSNSSSSSLSSARQDRTSRFHHNQQNSATPHSRSSEEMSEPPRRSQRSQPGKAEDSAHGADAAEEAAGDEEEITRCICGHQDYPGPPLSEAFSEVDARSEDAGGLFIQCDGCSVWQHGGCVGIIEESQSPDKYYCEECKPKQHELHTDSRGQKYSNYLPLHPKANRKSSVSKLDDKAKKDLEAALSRASADPATGRRRGTTRSKEHDDEEEQLQRAIEESRRDVEGSGTGGRRNGKRGRDDSEDQKPDIKRQRTVSESLTSATRTAVPDDDSEDESAGNGVMSKGKKARAEAAQVVRQAELREKEKERERARAEAAGRRQERAGRRRADESEPAEDTPKPGASALTSPPASSQPPSPPTFAAPEKISHKKGAGKKVKKLGNNQYTKNRDLSTQPPTSSPHSKKRQLANQNPAADSGEEQSAANGAESKNSPGAHEHGNNGKALGKFGKGKGKVGGVNGHARQQEELVERTFANMKRSMDGMMAFMQRHQIDMAGDRTPPGSDTSLRRVQIEDASLVGVGGAVQAPETPSSAPPPVEPVGMGMRVAGDKEKAFEELGSMEMADVLARSITRWNALYGQFA